MSDLQLLADIEQFIFREVRLLDERRFEDWMALFTDDGYYWVPTQFGQASPQAAASIFFDDRNTMLARVTRLLHPDAHIQAPVSHTAHLVSNIELAPGTGHEAGDGSDISVYAAFLMTEYRSGEPRQYAGRYEYRLRRAAGSWRMAMKKAELVNCNSSFTAMAIYL
jgi:3-phenylpropionate/cinnamic acid dioxygenase small subunit